MNIQETLIQAMKNKNLISFCYENKPIRKVSPHVIYISPARNTNLDAYQYDGHSKTGGLPAWRNFILEKITKLEILGDIFEIAAGYNPNSPKYNNFIYKI